METKRCPGCRLQKDAACFSKRSELPHLLRSICKSCTNRRSREYKRAHPELGREHQRLYRLRHPEDIARYFTGLGKYRFNNARFFARRRGIEWSISREQYYSLIKGLCEYCGGDLPKYGTGLDRANSSLGYHPRNVVPCCTVCNVAKQGYFTFGEMKRLGLVIAQIRESRRAREALSNIAASIPSLAGKEV